VKRDYWPIHFVKILDISIQRFVFSSYYFFTVKQSVGVKYLTISDIDDISYNFHCAYVAARSHCSLVEGKGLLALIDRVSWQGQYNRQPDTRLLPAAMRR
jgi:hypothetical protein